MQESYISICRNENIKRSSRYRRGKPKRHKADTTGEWDLYPEELGVPKKIEKYIERAYIYKLTFFATKESLD